MARRACHMAATLTGLPPEATQSLTRSTRRASGCAAAWARSQSRSTRRGLLPPTGRGSTSPVSRLRRRTRSTVALPTPNISAVSSYVLVRPVVYASTRLRFKSTDMGAIASFDHRTIAGTRSAALVRESVASLRDAARGVAAVAGTRSVGPPAMVAVCRLWLRRPYATGVEAGADRTPSRSSLAVSSVEALAHTPHTLADRHNVKAV